MYKPSLRNTLALTGLALLGLASASAHAQLVITPTFDASITGDPNAAAIESTINQAIQFYQNTFTDPINVTIDFQEKTSGLGGSSTTLYNPDFAQTGADSCERADVSQQEQLWKVNN